MLREIHEQPEAVAKTIKAGFQQARKIVRELDASSLSTVYFTGSGTSYHACLAVNYALSTLTRISSTTLPASEFSTWVRASKRTGTVLVAISQSGESVDILAALNSAANAGMRTVSVTNTSRSSLARQSEFGLLAEAGLEEAVTATKSFTSTLAAAYAFVIELADALRSQASSDERLKQSLSLAPDQIRLTIALSEESVKALTSKFADKHLYFILGSGPNYPTALEGALKIKEACNLYSEGFATREFLHGPMQLVDERTPIFMLQGAEEPDKLARLEESFLKFGAPTVVIKRKTADSSTNGTERIIVASDIEDVFSPLAYVVPLQLFAFYTALERGLNPDNPVKLTKVIR